MLATPVFAQEPKFEPVTIQEHIYGGGWEHFVGGGVAVFDCDGDDLPDVFAAGGENPSILFRNQSAARGAINLQDATPAALRIVGVIGAYPIDIDNDALTDLVVLRVGANMVLKGGLDCTFAPFSDLNIDLGSAWTTAFSATWEHAQNLPTLAFGNYVDRSDPNGPFEACDKNILQRPKGRVYAPPINLDEGYCPLSMLFSDWSRNGRADLRISNDRHYYVSGGAEQMWAMEPTPRLFGEADGWNTHQLWGMGIASRDINGDGIPEVMMTSMGDQRLQSRDLSVNGPTYRDMPFDLGATAHRPYVGGDGRPSTGWHVAFGDVQNDGLDDIFVAKGNVEQMPGLAMKDPNNLLIQQNDGRFSEVGEGAGLASLHRGRGAAVVDLNGDGGLDVVVVNRRAPMEVYQNTTGLMGHWISVQFHQEQVNLDSVGAWIEVDTGAGVFAREVTIGGGHAGGHLGFQHFGLGTTTQIRLRVIWPDQKMSNWIRLDADQNVHLVRKGNDLIMRP